MTAPTGVPILAQSEPKPAAPVVKPGWQTSEFYLKLAAMALTALFASGALTNNTLLAVAGMAASMLGALGYTVSRTLVKTAGAMLLVALLAHGSMACSASAREKAIQTTLTTTDAARAAFEAFDQPYQQALLNKAPDKPTFDKQLAAYRAQQAKILTAFAVAYRAIAAAATANDQPTLDGMVQAALVLAGALKDLGVPL